MPPVIVTSVTSYVPKQLGEAMRKVAEEANAAATRGYVLVGFQVVEGERVIVSAYRKQSVGAPSDTGARLFGD